MADRAAAEALAAKIEAKAIATLAAFLPEYEAIARGAIAETP